MIVKALSKDVQLDGAAPVLFDQYIGGSLKSKGKTTDPTKKLYLNDKSEICLPALNLISFLTAQNTESAPKLLLDARTYKGVCSAILASVNIRPTPLIQFLRDGKPIVFGKFDGDGYDKRSGVRVVYHVARLKNGIPNEKERPMLELPWQLKFTLDILPHPDLSLEFLEQAFTDGGARLGIGTYRKAFGKFRFEWA